jgi:hypothetical protein
MREDDRVERDPNLRAAFTTDSANVKQREAVAAAQTDRPLQRNRRAHKLLMLSPEDCLSEAPPTVDAPIRAPAAPHSSGMTTGTA